MRLSACLLAIGLAATSACNGGSKAGDSASASDADLAVTPPVGGQGTSVTVKLETSRSIFNFSGVLSADFGDGVVVDDVTVSDGWTAVADLTIEPDAALGPRDVSVDMDGTGLSLPGGFEVISQSLEVDPGSGRIGETVDLTFLGHNTDWASGVTWPVLGDDIDILDFTVLSNTLATGTVVISPDAIPGLRDVTLAGGGESLTLYDGFKVDRVGLAATFDPTEAAQGETIEFTIVGRDTNFSDATTLAFYDAWGVNPDISVLSITALDAENLYGRMTLSNAAALGMRDVLITTPGTATGDEGVLIPDAFEVMGGDTDLTDVAISLGFNVVRGIDNATGEVSESVSASCWFFLPVDPSCPPNPEDDPSECTDGVDNDADGFVDCLDSDCGNSGVCPSPSPYDADVIIESPDNGAVDCPTARTVGAGAYVWLESASNTVTLERYEDTSSGSIYYVGVGLTMDDYVPGETYALHTQGEDGGLGEYVLDGVLLTVPADWHLLTPPLWNNDTHSRAEDFDFTWTPALTYPDAIFSASLAGMLEATGTSGAIAALPWDDGEFGFAASDVEQLSAGPATFSAYSAIKGPYFGLPDSIYQSNQAQSYIYEQGSLVLE